VDGSRVGDSFLPYPHAWQSEGKNYLTLDGPLVMLRDAQGSPFRKREFNGMSSVAVRQPGSNFLTIALSPSTIGTWRDSDFQAQWLSVLLPDGKVATFSGAGELPQVTQLREIRAIFGVEIVRKSNGGGLSVAET
jgi:hypothetical protein